MKKSICFFSFIFYIGLFSNFALAALSKQEKKEAIEKLAKPYPENKRFYRWLSKEELNKLLDAEEMNTELFREYMQYHHDRNVLKDGAGFYVSGNKSGLLFTDRNGEALSYNAIQSAFNAGFTALNLSWHSTLIY